MIVRELIAMLEAFDPELPIHVFSAVGQYTMVAWKEPPNMAKKKRVLPAFEEFTLLGFRLEYERKGDLCYAYVRVGEERVSLGEPWPGVSWPESVLVAEATLRFRLRDLPLPASGQLFP